MGESDCLGSCSTALAVGRRSFDPQTHPVGTHQHGHCARSRITRPVSKRALGICRKACVDIAPFRCLHLVQRLNESDAVWSEHKRSIATEVDLLENNRPSTSSFDPPPASLPTNQSFLQTMPSHIGDERPNPPSSELNSGPACVIDEEARVMLDEPLLTYLYDEYSACE